MQSTHLLLLLSRVALRKRALPDTAKTPCEQVTQTL
jgi:hypothetical protein